MWGERLVEPRGRLGVWTDRVIAALITAITLGSVLAFGGQVWWIHLFLAGTTGLIVVAMAVRACCRGSIEIVRTPLNILALAAVALGVVQLVPLPAGVARALSARQGVVASADVDVSTESELGRIPITADRSATLRWVGGASVCLVLFWCVTHFTDRISRLRLVSGAVVAGFGVATVFGLFQVAGQGRGAYGVWVPGRSPVWAPTLSDVLAGPGQARLEGILSEPDQRSIWAVPSLQPVQSVGPFIAGKGGYLALGAMALPLALGLFVHGLAPRGSRERVSERLRHGGGVAPLVSLGFVAVLGAGLSGFLGGLWLAAPLTLGLVVTALASAWGTHQARVSLAGLAVVLTALVAGVSLSAVAAPGDGLASDAQQPAVAVWKEAARMIRDYPALGVGMASFGAVEPHIKNVDLTSRTAQNSVLQWGAECGVVGLVLLGIAVAWGLARLPAAWRSVGSADRALPGALAGACVSFATLSAIHWTVQIIAVALAAAALVGMTNRWLAGGTDLFVEPA